VSPVLLKRPACRNNPLTYEEYLEDVSYKSGTTLNIALVTNNLKLERRWKKVQT
jgi:hypothetical protein